MPPRSKKSLRMKNAAEKRWSAAKESEETPKSSPLREPLAKVPPDVHVTAALLTASTYTQSRDLFRMVNLDCSAESTFYLHQKEIAPKIEELANETVKTSLEQSKGSNSPKISIDSRWSSRRNGSQNTAVAIDVNTNKVISYKNTIKTGGKREGDFSGPSNMMESQGIESISADLKRAFGNREIEILHDGDNKSQKIFEKHELNVAHSLDKGHAMGALKRNFEKAKSAAKDDTKIPKPFFGIENRVISYASHLIDHVDEPEKREILWRNTPEHLIGNHENCQHDLKPKVGRKPKKAPRVKQPEEYYVWKKGVENPKLKDHLQNFCDKTANIVKNVSNDGGTNPNESINANEAKYANKRFSFGNSYGARIGIAVGKWNDPLHFTKNVLEATGSAQFIAPSLMQKIEEDCNSTLSTNLTRQSPYERKKINLSRKKARENYKTHAEGDYNEKKLKSCQ